MPVTDETRLKRKYNDNSHNLLTDEIQYCPDSFLAASPSDETRNKWMQQSRRYVGRQNSGWASPICHLIVLDTLLASQPPLLIRANRMAAILNDSHPHYDWHPMTVGRILNQIYDTAIRWARDGDGSMSKGRDWHGGYFTYDPTLDVMQTLWQMREWIGPRCTPYRKEANAALPTFVWEEFEPDLSNPPL